MKDIIYRKFDYVNAPEKLFTPEMVRMLTDLHELKGRQDIILRIRKSELDALEKATGNSGVLTSVMDLKVRNFTLDLIDYVYKKYILTDNKGKNLSSVYEIDRYKIKTLDNMCNAFDSAWKEERIDKLLLIPIFCLDMYYIQPYEKDNAKLVILLSLILLRNAGCSAVKYVRISDRLDQSTVTFNNIIKASSAGWLKEENDYSFFVTYFLSIVRRIYNDFEQWVMMNPSKTFTKADMIKLMINTHSGKITKKEIMDTFPEVSKITIERVLAEMVRNSDLLKVGGGPATGYIKMSELL